tara:strand:- start:1933 stop:2067 length:135 start_codon:yes stop_codon:yes gene_type:complete
MSKLSNKIFNKNKPEANSTTFAKHLFSNLDYLGINNKLNYNDNR